MKGKMKTRASQIQFHPFGDAAVRIQVGHDISPGTHKKVRSVCRILESTDLRGVVEWIPAYTSVTVFYDPSLYSFSGLVQKLDGLVRNMETLTLSPAKTVKIPTCYGGEYGPDLANVADINGLRPDDVVRIHTEPDYLIYMMGFVPGFPYLGGMSKKIAAPRLSQPRLKIPAGSVGIAGEQTGIYPMETPGGWHIIGRTPLRLFEPERENPMLLNPGDQLRFVPISEKEYKKILTE